MRRIHYYLLLASIASCHLSAQVAITSFTTSTTLGSNTTHDTPAVTFQNNVTSIQNFTATGGQQYQVTGIADQAYIRRNTGSSNANNSSVWYRDGTGGAQAGTYSTNYGALMLQNNINSGSDNTFANGTGAQDGNIERMDFVFSGGRTASASQVFAVLERGVGTAHDLFKIAVITGWDSVNNVPTSYGTLVGPSSSAAWGTANPTGGGDFGYHLFRYNTGDNLTTSTAHTETGTQGIGGIMFTMAQLGITAGTTIYGYSIFGNDVTGSGSQLVDYTNTTYFPTNTPNTTGTGGIDLATVNGLVFTAVPEPATYALAGVGAMLLGALWHRRRRKAAPQAGT